MLHLNHSIPFQVIIIIVLLLDITTWPECQKTQSIATTYQISTFSETGSFRMTSGAIQATVPAKDILVLLSLSSFEVPKSEIFTRSSYVISMLPRTGNKKVNTIHLQPSPVLGGTLQLSWIFVDILRKTLDNAKYSLTTNIYMFSMHFQVTISHQLNHLFILAAVVAKLSEGRPKVVLTWVTWGLCGWFCGGAGSSCLRRCPWPSPPAGKEWYSCRPAAPHTAAPGRSTPWGCSSREPECRCPWGGQEGVGKEEDI